MTSRPNVAQFDSWNGESGRRWVATADTRDRVLAPVADALVAAAAVTPGDSVLDLGCGATSIRFAEATGLTGSVTGMDLSAPMLDVARNRTAGAANVVFVQGDAQTYRFASGSVDVAVSRFGTMFFDDPTRAFANVAGAMRNDARLCLAVWRPLVDNEWLLIPGGALLRHAELPPGAADGPGMFAQSDPVVVRGTLDAAGFSNVVLDPVDVTFDLGATIDDAIDYLSDSGPGRVLLDSIPERQARDDAVADVRATLARHADSAGV